MAMSKNTELLIELFGVVVTSLALLGAVITICWRIFGMDEWRLTPFDLLMMTLTSCTVIWAWLEALDEEFERERERRLSQQAQLPFSDDAAP